MQPQFILPTLPTVHVEWFINKPVLFGVFVVFSVGYAVVSLALIYHWWAYGMRSLGIMVGAILFLTVSTLLFMLSLASLGYF